MKYELNDLKKNEATPQDLKRLYNASACTMIGYMPEELHLYINQLAEGGFLGNDFQIYTTTTSMLNEVFELDRPFDTKSNVFVIDLDDMQDIEKFAITLRFQMGYRWLDDVVDNRVNEFKEEYEDC